MPEIVSCLSYEVVSPPDNVFEFGKMRVNSCSINFILLLNINLSNIIGNLGEKFYMILDGEVSVLIPNTENRNFSQWLQTLIEERKNYERLIEMETKRLQLIKEKLS